jgi:RNA polymerase sigma-70 factor, ECF subfamily
MNLTSIANEDVIFQPETLAEFPAFVAPIAEESTTDNTDLELLKRVADGSIVAFEEIYNRYHRKTYSLCMRMLQNASEAEDLTQEVYIQLFRKIGSFRGDSAFSTWLHRLTVNQVLMHFRKRSVKNEKTTESGEIPEIADMTSVGRSRNPLLDRIDIDRAVNQLPNGYKSVFVLHDIEGFEHEEISRKMGISVGTSKSQLHKARLKLRGILKKRT